MGIVICRFCEGEFDPHSDDVDPNGKGFFCSCCDGYTFFSPSDENRKYTLILETKGAVNQTVQESSKVKLQKRISILRYPGGKAKIAHHILNHLNKDKTDLLVSPYCGGAGAELSLLHAGIVKELILNDVDFGIYSLFQMIKTFPDALVMEIRTHTPTHQEFIRARNLIKSGYHNCDMFEAAWSMLLVNRLAYSGIYKANPMGGIRGDQSQLLARWRTEDLCKRIYTIHRLSDRITVRNEDALQVIEEFYWNERATIFIDPPFVAQGEHLYRYFYREDDHYDLQRLLDELYKGFPCADLLLTYDDDPLIESIYEYPTIERIKRSYSA